MHTGGQLTEAVRRKPYSVVLFDEVEKAHADVFNVLLQILDDGRVTDSQGRVVSFKNTIIILTSNLGTTTMDIPEDEEASRSRRYDAVMAAVRSHFRPEFVNRIDEFAIFDQLRKDQIKEIVRMQVHRVAKRLESQRIGLIASEAAIDHLVDKGFDPVYGARPVKRAVQRELETPLARSILKGEFEAEDVVSVDDSGHGLQFSKGR